MPTKYVTGCGYDDCWKLASLIAQVTPYTQQTAPILYLSMIPVASASPIHVFPIQALIAA